MTNLIETTIKTRELTAGIFAKSLVNIDGLSEVEIANKILNETKNHSEIFPEGWYSPPPRGIAVLLCQLPFQRLKYESLRKPEYWPQENFILEKETVGLIYFSPVNKCTGLLADIGFTLYTGDNEKIKQHLQNCYRDILEVAKHAKVGMKFSELSEFALDLFKNKYKLTQWVTTNSIPDYKINLGHTIPGTFEENLTLGKTFDEVKQTITTKRLHVKETESFKIPPTCAFTIECRLEDITDPNIPSGYFHFIVCFDQGKKTILENYREIFAAVGMDYMNSK